MLRMVFAWVSAGAAAMPATATRVTSRMSPVWNVTGTGRLLWLCMRAPPGSKVDPLSAEVTNPLGAGRCSTGRPVKGKTEAKPSAPAVSRFTP